MVLIRISPFPPWVYQNAFFAVSFSSRSRSNSGTESISFSPSRPYLSGSLSSLHSSCFRRSSWSCLWDRGLQSSLMESKDRKWTRVRSRSSHVSPRILTINVCSSDSHFEHCFDCRQHISRHFSRSVSQVLYFS